MRNSERLIGIWWDNGEAIVAIKHPVDVNLTGTELVDSNHSHADEWINACQQLKLSPEIEYFVIPRGRVLYRPQDDCGLIYLTNSTGHGQTTATW